MVTWFGLEMGYDPNEPSGRGDFNELLNVVKSINLETFKEKCIEYGCPEVFSCGCKLDDFINKYKKIPTDDLTCVISTSSEDKNEKWITQYAGSSGGHRDYREKICRAFGVCVLDECYKKGMAISFNIH